MTSRSTRKGFWLVGTATLVLAAPALAVPASKEYVPKIPKAAGQEVVAGGAKGAGATVVQPAARGAKAGGAKARGATASGATAGEGSSGNDSSLASTDDSSGGGSGNALDALLNPVALLVIAGVSAAAIGMTLRQRGDQGKPDPTDKTGAEEPRSSRPTPDGEIVPGD